MKRALIMIFFITGIFYFLFAIANKSKYPNTILQKVTSKQSNISKVDIVKNDSSASKNIKPEEIKANFESDIDELKQAAVDERAALKVIEESEKFNVEWYKYGDAMAIINTPTVKIVDDLVKDSQLLCKSEFLIYLSDSEDKTKFEAYMKSVLDCKKGILNSKCSGLYKYTVKNQSVGSEYLAKSGIVSKNYFTYSIQWEKST